MNSFLIRPRRDADLPACVAVMSQVHHADSYPVNWPADPSGFLTSGAQFNAWVAVDGDVLLGHVVLSDADTERTELAHLDVLPATPLAGVSRLFVSPQARGRGIAGRLLETAAKAAAADGRGLVLSVVDNGKSAVAVYEHLGWRHIADLAADWPLPDGGVPQLRYYLGPLN